MTTKIPLAADLRCRPITGSPRQGNGTLMAAFIAVIADSSIIRGGGDTSRTKPDPVLAGRRTRPGRSGMRCRAEASRRRSPEPSNRIAGRASRSGVGGARRWARIYTTRNIAVRPSTGSPDVRAVATTTYDKRELVSQGAIDVASTGISLRTPADCGLRDSPSLAACG